MKTLLRSGWEFIKRPLVPDEELPAAFPKEQATAVTVPHDWLIWDTKNLYEDSLGLYRRTFEVTAEDEVTLLYFEGVYMDCTLFVNGQEAGCWKYGYSSFYFDVTEYTHIGENELFLRVVHKAPNSRWYSGAGIYRPVWQISKKRAHFLPDRFAAEAIETKTGFDLKIRTVASEKAKLRCTVFDAEGRAVGRGEGAADESITMHLSGVRRWSLESPYLYTIEAELLQNNELQDKERFRYGFRTWRFDADEGFFLNEKHIKLQGVCLHHDQGLLGAAYHPAAAKRQLRLMREMGVNAIRTSHNMPAPHFLELCDEMGFVVIDEFVDVWRHAKTEYDYARFFDDWVERDVASWIRRDRLHPSVVMWSIGNEIYDTHEGPEGKRTMRYLMDLVRLHDPEEHAAITLGSNFMAGENTQRCADILKLIGYNYAERLYDEHHAAHPEWKIYGSETCSTLQSRGIYHFPYEQPVLTDDDLQCSVLGNTTTSWGAKDIPFILEFEAGCDFSAGQFIWTGIDYIGEPTPYTTKNSYFGMCDTAGFPKDSYYLFQAAWREKKKEEPVLHLYPYWDWNPGQMIDLMAASDAAEVEVLVNGKSLGRKALDPAAGKVLAHFKAPYEEGEAEAIAYDAEGREIARTTESSFGDAAEICLAAEAEKLRPGDLAFISISMRDEEGNLTANANNEVYCEVAGPARLLGLDNGDSTDYDPYKTNRRRLFSGKLLAVLEPEGAGEIRFTVSSPGLLPKTLRLIAEEGDYPTPQLPLIREEASQPADVPIRKLELRTDAARRITPAKQRFTIEAKAKPANATYRDIDWRITNVRGADSLIAELKKDPADPFRAEVKVKGDGDFTVRCLPKNGREHYAFISSLDFTAEGFGKLQMDPYAFISASLYTAKDGAIGDGNERGILSDEDKTSWVAFENLNFGSFGSDLLRVPIFSRSDEHHYRLWSGIPYQEGSKLLLDEKRHLPSVWNTYQEMVFRLPYRLKGIETLALEMPEQVMVKGFVFDRQDKAFANLRAAEADEIYGDQYEKEEVWVRHIGNNVSLSFHDMDFAEQGTEQIRLTASSALPLNSVQLLFEDEAGTYRESLEFEGPAEEKSKVFRFKPQYGKKKVTLIFLPGTALDLKSIAFIPCDDGNKSAADGEDA